jgi:hypothetical protein
MGLISKHYANNKKNVNHAKINLAGEDSRIVCGCFAASSRFVPGFVSS